jgi:hypothetical protein
MGKKISKRKPLKKAVKPASKKKREAEKISLSATSKTKIPSKALEKTTVKKKSLKKPSAEKKTGTLQKATKKKAAGTPKKAHSPVKLKTARKKETGIVKKTSKTAAAQEIVPARIRRTGKPVEIKRAMQLPEEYGEDELLLMAVDTGTIFASWEITKDSLPQEGANLAARMYAMRGESGSVSFDSFLDISIDQRVGNGFFDIAMPGRDVMMEMGFFMDGEDFKAIVRSQIVSIPSLLTFDELGVVKKLFESGIPVGY